MNSVTQRHQIACGIACVAYITKIPYDALAQEQSATKLNQTGFMCPELVKLLNEHGLRYRWKKLIASERDSQFKVGDIVFIERSPLIPDGHFLTRTTNGWMDPWINLDAKNPNISDADSGIRPTLPGRAEYLIYQSDTLVPQLSSQTR